MSNEIIVDTEEEWDQAQYAARQIEAIADGLPGWMRDQSGVDDVIYALYQATESDA